MDMNRVRSAAARAVGAALLAALAATTSADTVNVMTFNLRYASAQDGDNNWENAGQNPARRDVAVAVLTNFAPDLVGFQEGEDVQIDYLDAQLPGRYGFERQKPSGGGGNENAAFAYDTNRLVLLDRGVFSLGPSPGGGCWNNPPGSNYLPWVFFPNMGLGFPRVALWGRFRWRATGQELLFYTTHFDFNNDPQVGSARLITDDARSRNARMPASPLAVVVGDFNSTHANNDWKLFTGAYTNNGITGDFTDSWRQVHGTWVNSGTIHGFSGGTQPESSRIDWILHRGGCAATNAQIVSFSQQAYVSSSGTYRTQYPSDHYPVVAALRLPPPAPDFDVDGLPDALERASTNALPADPDTDNDLLTDGEEDLDGDGQVQGGETSPFQANAPQRPTDIRNHQMDGVRDHAGSLLASNGLQLYWRFDGRYLYVATQDAGEGSDHFIFISTNPAQAVAAPWAKAGQVARWTAFLADENDNSFAGWFDAAGSQITDPGTARSAAYFANGGWVEGVMDLSVLFGAGFTSAFHLAAAPYATADGGALYAPAQAPAGDGDGHVLGASEFVRVDPGDRDHDGISDYADADADGDGLPDRWETAHGLDPVSSAGPDGADGDPDGDRTGNRAEFLACTRPSDSNSVFRILSVERGGTNLVLRWPSVHGKAYAVAGSDSGSLSNSMSWSTVQGGLVSSNFPLATNPAAVAIGGTARFYRVAITP
jgi:hypothetical protein